MSGEGAVYKSFLVWAGVFLSSAFGLLVVWFSGLVSSIVLFEWEFLNACGISLSVLVLFDLLSVLFSFTVCLISGCVFVYSVSYMESDKFKALFSSLVAIFVLSMNVLIFIPNLVFVLLGWDLLGITSFFLVIYYQNSSSVGAGMLTVLMNRIGDVFLVLSIGLSSGAGVWGVLSCGQISDYLVWISLLLVGASLTKSAQVPFSVWLPAAMAAPTPVSALVHSSTLVTVGVYFLFRHYHLLVCVDDLLPCLSKVGCFTLLVGSIGACCEFDIKKLIALSTLSHLGFMVYIMGIGYPGLSFFHLLSHALFKSLLFLCAGSYIHEAGSSQDLRQMSGLAWKGSSILAACSIVGFSSLCGVPYMSGFYSKDAILEGCVSLMAGVAEVVCLVVGAMASCFYMVRVLFYSIFGSLGGFPLVSCSSNSWFIGAPIFLLSFGSIIFGYGVQKVWVGSCEVFSVSFVSKMGLFFLLNLGLVSFMWSSHGYIFSGGGPKSLGKWLKFIGVFFCSLWFLRWCFSSVLGPWFLCGELTVKSLESGWMEVMGGQGVGKVSMKLTSMLLTYDEVGVLVILRLILVSLFGLVFVFL
uniref:NADH-ubiquinone oxidoreductase chain 5 n=1 Tax=Parvasolenaia rivularis TaxID=1491190 RepID=A0A3G1GHC9_9BIVA|nr:NADH dehydrogenase subunit 5 [Parvasolenaia rivularis]